MPPLTPIAAESRAHPFYFDSAEGPLFGWYHAPTSRPRNAAVVICPPFGVEAVFANRALRHLAERLAADGFGVLRYDHHGTGDSPGSEETPGLVRAWKCGAAAALDAVRGLSGLDQCAIVAMRFGTTLAGAVAAERGDVASIVMWAPIINGRRYARELRAYAQTGEGQDAGVGGILVTPETLSEIAALDLNRLEKAPAPQVLLIPRDDLPDDGGAFRARLGELGASVQTVNAAGYAGAMEEPHNTVVPTAVIDAVSSWLVGRHPVSDRLPTPIRNTGRCTMTVAAPPGSIARDVVERPAFLDSGKRLFGIVAEPAGTAVLPTGIVLVNAGAVSRIGPHRFYVSLAREWAAAGFRVLRMDIGGIGDSLAANGATENDTYPTSAGADVATGLDALTTMGAKNVVVVGLCSGAHAAFHVALNRVDRTDLAGVVMINPIVFYWKPGDALDVSAWQNYVDSRRLQRVVLTRDAWTKLARGQVDMSRKANTLVQRVVTVTKAAVKRTGARLKLTKKDKLATDLVRLTEGPVDVAFVFSNGDPGYDQLTLHANHVLGRLQQRSNFSVTLVPDADHTFTPIDSQRRVRRLLFEHLTKRFASAESTT